MGQGVVTGIRSRHPHLIFIPRGNFNLMKRLSYSIRHFLVVVFYLFLISSLAACATLTPETPYEYLEEDSLEPVTGDDIAFEDSKAELLYNLLAGEFAGVHGNMQQAIDFYDRAAALSHDPEVITRAAYIAMYAGQDERAIELTNRWLQLKLPENNTISRIRVFAFLHLQRLQPAVDEIEKQLLIDGRLTQRAVSSISHILTKETEPEFALKVVEQLNLRHPKQAPLLLLQARFEANLEQYKQALQHADQLIELDPELADAYLIRAQALAAQGESRAAMQAIALAVEKRPNDARLRLQYGRMLVQIKEYQKASQQFLILQQALPNDEGVLLSLALLAIETGNYDQAKDYLQTMLNRGFNNPQATYYLARIEQDQGNIQAAIRLYEQVTAGNYQLDAKIRIASLMADEGKTDEAIQRLDSLTQLSQSEASRLKLDLARGQVLTAAGRYREAYALYDEALQQAPDNTDLLYARALVAEKLNMLDITESDLKTVIAREPDNASALNALGYTLADRTERLNEAREYILKAARLLPDDPAILDSLGWVYYRLGQHEDAIKWLSKAFEKLRDAEIAAHLGEVLWVSGKTEEARKIWQQGEKLDGNQTVLKDTIQRLLK